MSNKRIIDLNDSNQLDLNDYLAVYNSEPTADSFTFKRKISDVLALRTISVNGKTGNTINLTADDISDIATSKKFVTATEKSKIALIKTNLGGDVFLAGDGVYKTTSIGAGTGATNVIFTSAHTVILTAANHIILTDSSISGFTITLPSMPAHLQTVKVKSTGGALSHSVIVNGNGFPIEAPSVMTAEINSEYGCLEIIFLQNIVRWVVISFVI